MSSHLILSAFLIFAVSVQLSYQQSCETHSNSDINSPDIGRPLGQLADCCGICQGTPGCQGYAWNNLDGGTCWLKGTNGPIVYAEGVTAGTLSGDPPAPLVTFEEFVNGVVGTSHGAPSEAQYNAFIAGLHNGLISTKQEAAMALTHFIHESDGLVAKREYRCENNGCPGDYETAGCDVDGQDYYGRGYIQLTWCFNYQPCSYDLFGDDRLVQDPDQVARDEQTAWNAAFWYWKTNVHDKPGVQEGQFGATTRAINGILECDNGEYVETAKLRFQMYLQVRAAFAINGQADERGCYS